MASNAAARLDPPARLAARALPDRTGCTLTAISWRETSSDVAAWDRLALDAAEPNPFFESWYLLPSLEAFDPHGRICLLRFEQGGELRGLMPLCRPARYYGLPLPHMRNWLHDNSFFGAPLVASGLEVQFWHALLGWADANAGTALFLHLSEIDLGGRLHIAL